VPVLPSGGVGPDDLDAWWDAGATCIGMGSNLAGKDIGFPTDSPAFAAARADWEASGKAKAAQVFTKAAARKK